MWQLLLFVLCTPLWSDTKDILSCDTVQSGRYAPTFQSTCPLHHQGDAGGRFLSDDVTYLQAYSGWTKVTVNIIITTLRTSDLNSYGTQQVLEILAKIWLIWDCKLLYVWVVWLLGCVWTSGKVLVSACGWDLSCSLQGHVCPAGMWHCALW